ncbi:hypothetical protein HDU96_001284 [Phlyctochytrium bullatum]|nr:hypothetical protein HDU96_001284 [Phlyctochytrium bullatum]
MRASKKVSKQGLTDRLARLNRRDVKVDKLHPNLRNGVVGDYLTARKPTKNLRGVVKSYHAAMLVQQLLPTNPRDWLVLVIEDAGCTDRQEAAQIVQGIIDEKKKTFALASTFFHNFWPAVFKAIPGGRIDAVPCNQIFNFSETHNINWELSQRDIKAQVAYLFETEDGVDGTSIVDDWVFHDFWNLARAFPNHPDHRCPYQIKQRIKNFFADRDAGRLHSNLRERLLHHNIDLPRMTRSSKAAYLALYDEGRWFCHPDEAIAIWQVTEVMKEVFPHDPIHWCRFNCMCCTARQRAVERVQRRAVGENGIGWMLAAREVVGEMRAAAMARYS